ncbi:hypothetical protein PRK78_005718 [Emydomyces testavorans]|uniref:Uncharacterized protein n=1 Tax=Emydomyces testavorans TaxID=2070801 RepID=A0AAF0DL88_9EURO|nr:hypothetical protein PRK78_005718 [Emydomyces testavorans]
MAIQPITGVSEQRLATYGGTVRITHPPTASLSSLLSAYSKLLLLLTNYATIQATTFLASGLVTIFMPHWKPSEPEKLLSKSDIPRNLSCSQPIRSTHLVRGERSSDNAVPALADRLFDILREERRKFGIT